MTRFAEPPEDDYAVIYLEDTDRPLPRSINPNTRYAYFKTIARGGKSIIQSCRDMHLGRVICYKSLRPEFRDDEIENRRFVREARVTASLQHPNTVPTYELGRDNQGNVYFTMKWVHGYTLRELLDYRERYDLSQLTDVLVQILNALQYAHGHRVVHRDVKPENILVGPFGEVLLLDWGLAKVWTRDGHGEEGVATEEEVDGDQAVSSITDAGKLQGTIAYMSPEQIRRDPNIDYATDIYSLGAVFYEILSGRTPGDGDTVDKMSKQILDGGFPPPSAVSRMAVPEHLDQLAMRCLATDPEARISASDLIRLLQEEW